MVIEEKKAEADEDNIDSMTIDNSNQDEEDECVPYTDILIALVTKKKVVSKEDLNSAFRYFDID